MADAKEGGAEFAGKLQCVYCGKYSSPTPQAAKCEAKPEGDPLPTCTRTWALWIAAAKGRHPMDNVPMSGASFLAAHQDRIDKLP